jgi:site-specific DNA recombinase
VAADWNERGLCTAGGRRWKGENPTRTLRSARLAGLRTYHGEVLGAGRWEPVLERGVWESLQPLLRHRSPQRGPRRFLLTGLARCGKCGARLGGRRNHGRRTYACRAPLEGGCAGVAISADALEDEVAGQVLALWAAGGFDEARAGADDQGEDLRGHLMVAEASLAELSRDYYTDKLISREEFLANRRPLEDQIAGLRRQLIRRQGEHLVVASGDQLVIEWESVGCRGGAPCSTRSSTRSRWRRPRAGSAARSPKRTTIRWRA